MHTILMFAALWVSILGPALAADVTIGPSREIKTLSAGAAAALPHDTLRLDPGVYLDDVAELHIPLTIEGAVGGVILRITRPIANRRAIVIANADLTVRGLTFEGAHVTDQDGGNGAGIVLAGGNLTVEDCTFTNNQDGILVYRNPTSTVNIRRSAFEGNGKGDGYTHAVYVNEIAHLTVADSSFHGTKVGHNIKSRALRTTVLNTVLEDGVSGTASYAIDISNGGVTVLDGVTITQGSQTSNTTMMAYGAEGQLKSVNSLVITNSTFINTSSSFGVAAIYNFEPSIDVQLANNVFKNVDQVVREYANETSHGWFKITDGVWRWLRHRLG